MSFFKKNKESKLDSGTNDIALYVSLPIRLNMVFL